MDYTIVEVERDAGDIGAALGLSVQRMTELVRTFDKSVKEEAVEGEKLNFLPHMVKASSFCKTQNELAYLMYSMGYNMAYRDRQQKNKLDRVIDALEEMKRLKGE